MAIPPRDDERQMRALAQRVHRRWLEYRRRHPGMSVPISDTLSRILEHHPGYNPPRGRASVRSRPPLRNPGVFTLKEIATALQTTVGDLLGEPGYSSLKDSLPLAERRKLRDATALLRERFDLDDESLGPAGAPPDDFLIRDFAHPEPLHVWIVPEVSVAAEDTIREVADPRLRVIRIASDAMAPELRKGWKAVIDTARVTPQEGDLVALYLSGEGGIIGRWHLDDGRPSLLRSNASYPLDGEWTILGTVVTVVDAAPSAWE